MTVGVRVGVGVSVSVGVTVGVIVGVSVDVGVAVGVGVTSFTVEVSFISLQAVLTALLLVSPE